MGIFCEINLLELSYGAFVAGSTVKGVIRYAVDKETKFKQITVALKGEGTLSLQKKHNVRSMDVTNRSSEDYLNIENVIIGPGKELIVPVGAYDIPFNFKLPRNIPPSFHYSNNTVQCSIRCDIRYDICIKFERMGFWNLDKNYKKEITIESDIVPKLPLVSVVRCKQKKLMQLLGRKKSTVNIQACISKSVITSGENVELDYEVFNDTDVVVKSVETKLLEVFTFTTKTKKLTQYRKVPNAESKSGSIKCKEKQAMSVRIGVPSDLKSLDFSRLVSRDYLVQITAQLPFPHFNAVLMIPIQVGACFSSACLDPPPSYGEVMFEEEKNDSE